MKMLEKHPVKITIGTLLTIIIFCSSVVFAISDFKNDVTSEFEKQQIKNEYNEKLMEKFDERISILEDAISTQNIRYEVIENDLSYIKNSLERLEEKID